MRRLVAALLVALLALTLAGCGGGGGEAETPATTPAAPTAPTAPAAGDGTEPVDLSPTEPQVFERFPGGESVSMLPEDLAEITPVAIQDRLDADQPMIIVFYDATQSFTNETSAAVSAVLADYRGLIDYVSFDVGKYAVSDPDGHITIKADMATDEEAKKVATLLSKEYLNVTFTPYTVLVDSDGYITYRFRGPIDANLLEREVMRATD